MTSEIPGTQIVVGDRFNLSLLSINLVLAVDTGTIDFLDEPEYLIPLTIFIEAPTSLQ